MYKNVGRFLTRYPGFRGGMVEVSAPREASHYTLCFRPGKVGGKETIVRIARFFSTAREAKKHFDGIQIGYKILVHGTDIVHCAGDENISQQWIDCHSHGDIRVDPLNLRSPKEQCARRGR